MSCNQRECFLRRFSCDCIPNLLLISWLRWNGAAAASRHAPVTCCSGTQGQKQNRRHAPPGATRVAVLRRHPPQCVSTGARRDASSLIRAAVERPVPAPCTAHGQQQWADHGRAKRCSASAMPGRTVRDLASLLRFNSGFASCYPIQQRRSSRPDRKDNGCGGRRSVVVSAGIRHAIWAHLRDPDGITDSKHRARAAGQE